MKDRKNDIEQMQNLEKGVLGIIKDLLSEHGQMHGIEKDMLMKLDLKKKKGKEPTVNKILQNE